ncbi:hypothetical protein [Adhaeretor mobilis]|uniref:DUF1570 domain-containing protein n=1 Tax=Adhaeretor mobilis TaxID=1930276 RepID=A0A517N0P0_9BACT|nr:hypothetical protein [Adhaeretor mobilis]QDT00705.1 hypothetical protein HG15A2_40450 [Adhaeretor mobilis]
MLVLLPRLLLILALLSVAVHCAVAETQLRVAGDLYTQVNSEGSQVPPVVENDLALTQLSNLLAEENVGEALQLATRVVSLDPDNAIARRMLGYQLVPGPDGTEHWCGGYAALMYERGNLWHEEFGWIKAGDRDRWEAGERPWGKKWITPTEDGEHHATIARGWTVRTDHFHVTTNHSREAAVDLATRLETLHQIWRQQFGEFDVSARELQARLDGKQPTGYRRKPFKVIYHRTRDQYNAALLRRQPQIAKTLGIYFDRERETHFFAGEDQDPGTIYHEAVHQFFFESRKANKNFARLANAWATEGVACYFESLARGERNGDSSMYTLGGAEAGRLPAARHRRLVDNYYVPLEELSSLGMLELQRRKDLPRLYSQSAGLATFFMEYEGGKYRPAFRELLAAIYAGRDEPTTLEAATGVSFETLDEQYREFLALTKSLQQKTNHEEHKDHKVGID